MVTQPVPLPSPSLAILPQYISSTPASLTIKGTSFSKDKTVTLDNGAPLFTIQGESFSASHRRAVFDARTGSKLFEVRKDGMGTRCYYAEINDNGPRLFETESHFKMFGRNRISVTLANQAAVQQGQPVVEMEFVPTGNLDDGCMSLNGEVVAVVEKTYLSMGGEYHTSLAVGLDPALVVGVVVMMIDRANTKTAQNRERRRGVNRI